MKFQNTNQKYECSLFMRPFFFLSGENLRTDKFLIFVKKFTTRLCCFSFISKMLIVILEKTRFVVKKKKIQLTQIKTIIR